LNRRSGDQEVRRLFSFRCFVFDSTGLAGFAGRAARSAALSNRDDRERRREFGLLDKPFDLLSS